MGILKKLGWIWRYYQSWVDDPRDSQGNPLRGLKRECYFLVRAITKNKKLLDIELSHSASRGHCCDWCGASGKARQLDYKLNRQYTRLAAIDCKLGIPEEADYNRRWRAEQRLEHGHIEFFSCDQWRKPKRAKH